MSPPDAFSPGVIVAAAYAAASVATFAAYGIDKNCAMAGRRRIPESTLHFMELCGGWPGALVGMRAFRHKSSKLAFHLVTYAIVALHAAGWAVFLTQ